MGPMKREAKPASWALPADEKVLSQYVELVTDTISDSADPDNLTAADIVRASAEQLAACDFVLLFADAPTVGNGSSSTPDGSVTYLPMNLGYAPTRQTAPTSARSPSRATPCLTAARRTAPTSARPTRAARTRSTPFSMPASLPATCRWSWPSRPAIP